MSASPYFQDHCPENVCFGCGIANEHGLQIKSQWEGERSVCRHQPKQQHHGWPGVLCGGVLATIIDCHATNTGMAVLCREAGLPIDQLSRFAAVTGGFTIRYVAPTPALAELEISAELVSREGRKIQLKCESHAAGVLTATADVMIIEVDQAKMAALAGRHGAG